jgi:hypothetical protein
VKFRSDTEAITSALSARQKDLSMVPSCSGDLLLEIQIIKSKIVAQNIPRDAPN